MVTTWDVACGIAGYSRGLHDALAGAGTDVDVVAIDRAEQRYRTRPELRAGARDLAIRAAGADVVHVQHEHGLFAGSYGYRSSLRVMDTFMSAIDAPAAVTLHTEPWPFGSGRARNRGGRAGILASRAAWIAFAHRHLNRRRRLAIVHTRAARRLLLDSGVDEARVRVVSQGVTPLATPAPGSPQALAARARLGLDPEDVVLTCFGFASHYKGLDLAARALLDLPDRFRLLVAGEPHPHSRDEGLDELLAVLSEEPQLRSRVTLTGHVAIEQLADLHAATDICLAPYRSFPRVASSAAITWALASGRPVVASHVPAFVELQDGHGCVELVTPGAEHELAWAVERLAGDGARRTALVERARAYVAGAAWDVAAREHRAIYEELAR